MPARARRTDGLRRGHLRDLARPPRRRLVIAVAVTAIVTLGSIMYAARDERPDPTGTLLIASGADVSNGRQRHRLIEEWNRRNPAYPARLVELSGQADLQRSQMVADAQSGGSYDVLNIDAPWTAEFARGDYIRPIEGFDTEGFLDNPLKSCSLHGRLWAVPFNADAGLLYYRSDVIPPGQIPTTWADLWDDAAEAVRTNAHISVGYLGQFAGYEGLTVNVLETIWGEGGVVDAEHVEVDSDDAQRALATLATNISPPHASEAVIPSAVLDYDETASLKRFAEGDAVFLRHWPYAYDFLKNTKDLRFGVAKLPGNAGALGAQCLAIAKNTPRPKAAKRLIEFLTSPESQRVLFEQGGLPASRDEVYKIKEVQAVRPYASMLRDAIEDAQIRPVTPYYTQFSEVFHRRVGEQLARRRPPDGASLKRDLQHALRGG